MATPTPQGQMMNPDANKGLLIAAWIFAIVIPLVGLILSIVGKNKGDPRFKAPLIVSIVFLVLGVLYFIMVMMAAA